MSFLQIASWNIEHLSGASRLDAPQTAYALAEHIEMAGIDIIAMQEIYVTSPAGEERRNDILDRVCELLAEHLHAQWDYVILPNRSEGDRSQLCAILWNTTRAQKGDVLKLDVSHRDGDDRLWDRTPHAVKFTMLIDVWHRVNGNWEQKEDAKSVVVVPLHMKSNYGGSNKARRVRRKEAETLCAQLDTIREIDPSIVLIGDTNCLRADEPAIDVFTEHGLIDLNNTDGATYWSHTYGESPFDRAFVAEDRDEFRYTRQYVLRSADLGRHDRFLSDHYMIKISVKTYLDDADPR
jgi:endonuclease/exonuclease/phosphatase family metal-dependent hydrolase